MGHLRNISLVLAISFAILHLSHAHDTYGEPGNTPDDYVHAHNCIRRVLGMKPLCWDDELAKVAQAWAETRTPDCSLIHSDRCGENMAQGAINGSMAVQLWLDERLDYDYNENKCIKMCGHYTQMVWANTERVGCGRALCSNGWAYIIVCNYDPPGNVVGQKPY